MLLVRVCLAVLGVCHAATAVRLHIRSGEFLNTTLSSTATALVSTAPPGARACCYFTAQAVHFLTWYTTGYNVTVATATTQYYKYNNTIISNVTTTFISNATAPYGSYLAGSVTLSGVPTNILDFQAAIAVNRYQMTFVGKATTTTEDGTTLTAPTPYAELRAPEFALYTMPYASTESGSDGSITCHNYYTNVEGGQTSTSFNGKWIPGREVLPPIANSIVFASKNFPVNSSASKVFPLTSSVYWAPRMDFQMPQNVALWLGALPPFSSLGSDLAGCYLVPGDGDPSVHIIATELTAHTSTTVTVPGNLLATQTDLASMTTTAPVAAPTPTLNRPVETNSVTSSTMLTESATQTIGYGAAFQSLATLQQSTPQVKSEDTLAQVPTPESTPSESTSKVGSDPTTQMPKQNAQSSGLGQMIQSMALGAVSQSAHASERFNAYPSLSSLSVWSQIAAIVGTSTIPLISSNAPGAPAPLATVQTMTLGSQVVPVIVLSSGGIVLPGDNTLSAGQGTTINNIALSVPTSANAVEVGGTTIPLTISSSSAPAMHMLTAGSQIIPVFNLPSDGIASSNSQTLLPGHATTMNGVAMSMSTATSAIVIGGTTIPLFASSSSSSKVGFGAYILSALALPPNFIPTSGIISVTSATATLVISQSAPNLTGTSSSALIIVTAGSQTLTLSYAPSPSGLILPNGQTLTYGGATTLGGVVLTLPVTASGFMRTSTRSGSLSGVTTSGGSKVSTATPTGRTTSQATAASSGTGNRARMGPLGWVLMVFVLVGMGLKT